MSNVVANLSSIHLDRAHYEEHGFLVLRNCLGGRLIEQIGSEISFVIRDQLAKFGAHVPPEDANLTDLVRAAFVPGSPQREFLYNFLRYTPTLRAFMASEFCVGLLRSLGFEMPLTQEIPSLRFDRAGEERYLTLAHQDLRSVRCDRAASMWFPLTPVNPEIGTVGLYPGSHRNGVWPYEMRNGHLEVKDVSALGDLLMVEAEPGDLILFNSLCVHVSVPARAPDAIRINGQCFWNDAARIDTRSPYYDLTEIPDLKELMVREEA